MKASGWGWCDGRRLGASSIIAAESLHEYPGVGKDHLTGLARVVPRSPESGFTSPLALGQRDGPIDGGARAVGRFVLRPSEQKACRQAVVIPGQQLAREPIGLYAAAYPPQEMRYSHVVLTVFDSVGCPMAAAIGLQPEGPIVAVTA